MDVTLHNARLSADAPVDLALVDGRIASIGPAGTPTGRVIDLDGRFVLPGLWDHHVHFDQWAMTRRRFDLSAAASAAQAIALTSAALRECADAIAVGFGYRDALWPDLPSALALDAATGTRPVVLISADLHSAWLNTAALARFGSPPHNDGRVVEQHAARIFELLTDVDPETLDAWCDEAARVAAARGVVGIVDLEYPLRLDEWHRRIANGTNQIRVNAGVWTARLDEVIGRGLRSADVIEGTVGLLTMGPFKVITDGSLNTRTAYCHDPYPGLTEHPHGILTVPPDQLVPLMQRARQAGIDCAIHAIGDHANSLALDAFAASEARGSIEHAQLLDTADVERFAELGITASVQPEHAMDDRDVADRHWAGRTERAFVLRSLLDAGARLTFGSDAPVSPLDPWLGIAAAVSRSRDGREPWHPEQAIGVEEALAASTRDGTTVGGKIELNVGDPADLIVVDINPRSADADALGRMPVAATFVAGRPTHGFDSQV